MANKNIGYNWSYEPEETEEFKTTKRKGDFEFLRGA